MSTREEMNSMAQEIMGAYEARLVDQVFAYLADRPDGTRLTELEDAFGTSRFETARIIRRLTDEGKVGKREMLYFAV